jgi:hypothetical protein
MHKGFFIGGPLHGQTIVVDEFLHTYKAVARKPLDSIHTFDETPPKTVAVDYYFYYRDANAVFIYSGNQGS